MPHHVPLVLLDAARLEVVLQHQAALGGGVCTRLLLLHLVLQGRILQGVAWETFVGGAFRTTFHLHHSRTCASRPSPMAWIAHSSRVPPQCLLGHMCKECMSRSAKHEGNSLQ